MEPNRERPSRPRQRVARNSTPPAATDSPAVARLRLKFIKSAPYLKDCPEDQGFEVALAGRSNVGKSSVINRIASQSSDRARVSQTPGATQMLNFFAISNPAIGAEDPPIERRLVDLPGYGFAKAPGGTRNRWQIELTRYLEARRSLVGLVLVLDIRHGIKDGDELLLNWTEPAHLPLILLLNKADKLSFSAQRAAELSIRKRMSKHPQAEVMLFSATAGLGQDRLLSALLKLLNATQKNPAAT